jgi:hypothetical protein
MECPSSPSRGGGAGAPPCSSAWPRSGCQRWPNWPVAAALIGQGYGQKSYSTLGERRTFEGSAAFFVATFLCVHLPLLLAARTGPAESVLIGFNGARFL